MKLVIRAASILGAAFCEVEARVLSSVAQVVRLEKWGWHDFSIPVSYCKYGSSQGRKFVPVPIFPAHGVAPRAAMGIASADTYPWESLRAARVGDLQKLAHPLG
ncbi:MAG: hypothetical protein ABI693_18735 [Bryobacteraceae bacterium]